MKLVVLYQAKLSSVDQPGYYQGFERMVSEGDLSSHNGVPYLGLSRTLGWDGLWNEAYKIVSETEADAVFLQFFHARMPDPTAGILRIKGLSNRPLIFSSLGDPFGRWTSKVSSSFRVASRLSDVSFLTGMGYIARQLAGWGAHNLVLMPNGACQHRFGGPKAALSLNPEFDVCFVGSRMRARNPLNHFYWTARQRVEFVSAFTKRYGKRFALFGKWWKGNPSWQGPISYGSQHEAYRSSAVVVGGVPNACHDYYTSDRVFIAAASGVPLVDYWVPGVDRLLKPERDWWLGRDIKEMIQKCDMLLEKSVPERQTLAEATRQRILSAHTQYHRCVEMINIVRTLRDARAEGKPVPSPKLPFLLDSSGGGTVPDSVVAWRG